MTNKDIIKRAFDLYPKQIYYKDNEKLFPIDANEDARNAYIKGVTDILTGGNVWKLHMASEKVASKLFGQETTVRYWGEQVIKEVGNLFE